MFKSFVANETLSSSAEWTAKENSTIVEADDKKWSIKIEKA